MSWVIQALSLNYWIQRDRLCDVYICVCKAFKDEAQTDVFKDPVRTAL